jgi:hypothetical protein
VLRSVAGAGHHGRVAPQQHLPDVHGEAGDVGRHHRRARRPLQRDLHQRVLHRHRRDAEQAAQHRAGRIRVDPRAGGDAEATEASEQRDLQQRPQRGAPHRFQAGHQQSRQTKHQDEDRNRQQQRDARGLTGNEVCGNDDQVAGDMGGEQAEVGVRGTGLYG